MGRAHAPIAYAATVIGWRGLDTDRERYLHLCFTRVSRHRTDLLARWIASLRATCAR